MMDSYFCHPFLRRSNTAWEVQDVGSVGDGAAAAPDLVDLSDDEGERPSQVRAQQRAG